MLLEFRVKNFRSFATEVTFSMFAAKDRFRLEENTMPTGIISLPRALRSAVVYGANASGKSDLIKAMGLMQEVVRHSAVRPQEKFGAQQFRLDKDSSLGTSLFEVTMLLEGVRHQYGFEITEQGIRAEWLLVYKTSRAQTWLDRRHKDGKERFFFSKHLRGSKTWREATRHNALFLSTAALLKSEQLKPLFQWFDENLVVTDTATLPLELSTRFLEKPDGPELVITFLRSAGLDVCSTRGNRQEALEGQFNLKTQTREQEFLSPLITHEAGGVRVEFQVSDESKGTIKMFSLAAPLLAILGEGKTLVADGLDNSLHPLLLRQIVRTFNDPYNRRGAQLIFSSHDTSLLQSGLMRWDQVWIAQKNGAQSELTPLTVFAPHKGEAVQRGYLSGRYGGIPVLRERLATSGTSE